MLEHFHPLSFIYCSNYILFLLHLYIYPLQGHPSGYIFIKMFHYKNNINWICNYCFVFLSSLRFNYQWIGISYLCSHIVNDVTSWNLNCCDFQSHWLCVAPWLVHMCFHMAKNNFFQLLINRTNNKEIYHILRLKTTRYQVQQSVYILNVNAIVEAAAFFLFHFLCYSCRFVHSTQYISLLGWQCCSIRALIVVDSVHTADIMQKKNVGSLKDLTSRVSVLSSKLKWKTCSLEEPYSKV